MEENWGALKAALSDEEEREIRAFWEGSESVGYRVMRSGKEFDFVDTTEEA